MDDGGVVDDDDTQGAARGRRGRGHVMYLSGDGDGCSQGPERFTEVTSDWLEERTQLG